MINAFGVSKHGGEPVDSATESEAVAASHKPLLESGHALSLQVNSSVRHRPDHSERQCVTDILTTKFEALGHQIKAAQDLFLTVSIEENIPEFDKDVTACSDGKKLKVPNEQLQITLELTDLDGKSHWKQANEFAIDFKPLEDHVEYHELHPKALRQRWDRLYPWLEAMRTPSQFYPWDLTGGIGKSTYGKSGEERETNAVFR